MYAIETNNLTKYYGKARGVIDLDLKVDEGDIFGFIGPNGSGKSTTIRVLLGMIRPTSGSAFIMGNDAAKNNRKVFGRIGYMPSETQFYERMKVSEVIKLAADLHRKDCTSEAKRLCDRFQLDTKKKIEALSLGNRKKVSIICALQHAPELIILDEPTSGLDPLMQKEFFDVLEEKNKMGTTIFFSSHVLPEIQNHCKNAAIIKDGKLIKVATVDELMKTSAKNITLSGIDGLQLLEHKDFRDNIANVENISDGIRFLYKGDIRRLIVALQNEKFSDITISEPNLDEIFMHFYQ